MPPKNERDFFVLGVEERGHEAEIAGIPTGDDDIETGRVDHVEVGLAPEEAGALADNLGRNLRRANSDGLHVLDGLVGGVEELQINFGTAGEFAEDGKAVFRERGLQERDADRLWRERGR